MPRSDDDCATIWFAILERAKNRNDFERAAEAQKRLREMGVRVKFETLRKGDAPSCK